jgi:hypothetical protein
VRTTRGLRSIATAFLVIALAACGADPETNPGPSAPDPSATAQPGASAASTAAPVPGHELYGYLPYWEMDDEGIVEHVAATPLTTLGLFSVTHTAKGVLNAKQRGYRLITGDVGTRLIRDAHERGTRVEIVYTSFGGPRNRKLLESEELQGQVIGSLVGLAVETGVDGINVDVEALDPILVPAYGGFVADLRAALTAANPEATVSVATGAHSLGAAMAVAAAAAGADRIFMMGYDYRTGRSQPGASAPLDRSDGEVQSLRRSLDLYAALGVPPERLLLGLPLYGVDWPVAGPVIGSPSTGRGEVWFPRNHVDLLTDPDAVPLRDEIEQVEVYFLGSDGTVGPPPSGAAASPTQPPSGVAASPGPSASGAAASPTEASSAASGAAASPTEATARTWRGIYVDSPGTLAPKMAEANARGLAGAGFWAIGYERGLPGYTRLMERFVAGEPLP